VHAAKELAEALVDIRPSAIFDTLVRTVTLRSLLDAHVGAGGLPEVRTINPDLLYAGGSSFSGGRFTPVGGPAALYLASSERTANAEWRSGSTLISRTARPPKVVFFAQVKLERVLDVTDNNNQLRLNTSAVELASDWKLIADSPTQRLGRATYDSRRFSGIWYRSTKDSRGYCLVVFPERLSKTEMVSVVDSSGVFSVNPLVGV